jgi:uncharacterized protein YbjT (DUF2867 family)
VTQSKIHILGALSERTQKRGAARRGLRVATDTVRRVKLLILGGTKFLGRATTEAALARGHDVTLFNRGETNPELFPEVEKLRGERGRQADFLQSARDADLSALEGRRWDAVVDPSGYVPGVVRASAEKLADSTDFYLFVSSLSVYADRSITMTSRTTRTTAR